MFDKMNFGIIGLILVLEVCFFLLLGHTPLDWWIDKSSFVDKI